MIDTTGNVKCPKCGHDKFDRYTKDNVTFVICHTLDCKTVIGVFVDYTRELNLIDNGFGRINELITTLNQERQPPLNHIVRFNEHNQDEG